MLIANFLSRRRSKRLILCLFEISAFRMIEMDMDAMRKKGNGMGWIRPRQAKRIRWRLCRPKIYGLIPCRDFRSGLKWLGYSDHTGYDAWLAQKDEETHSRIHRG